MQLYDRKPLGAGHGGKGSGDWRTPNRQARRDGWPECEAPTCIAMKKRGSKYCAKCEQLYKEEGYERN